MSQVGWALPTNQLVARWLGTSAAVVMFATIGVMIAEHVEACRRAPIDKQRVDELSQLVKQDDSQTPALEAERERQTESSLARTVRLRIDTYVLIVAAVLFLVGAKWFRALNGRRTPSPEQIAAHRAAQSRRKSRRRRQSRQAGAPFFAQPSRVGTAHQLVGGQCPPYIDPAFVDETIDRHGCRPAAVIPILHTIQSHYRYLPQAALQRVCELTEITPAQIAGVSSFHTRFRHSPAGRHIIKVCHGTACHVAGAQGVTDEIRRQLGIKPDADTDPTGEFTIEQVACMGCCTLAPVARIDELTYGHLAPDMVSDVLDSAAGASGNGAARDIRALPVRAGVDRSPVGEIRIGLGSCCVAGGSGEVHQALQRAVAATGTRVAIKRVGCVGMCHQTPLVEAVVPGQPTRLYAGVDPQDAKAIVRRHFQADRISKRITNTVSAMVDNVLRDGQRPPIVHRSIEPRDPPVAAFLGPQRHIATEHCGQIDPTDMDEYLRHDGFQAYQRCIKELSPQQIIEEISRSGLRGRGGAGFPTGRKWATVRAAVGDHKYVICNGDEGDPGAFMDRMLMESFPYRVIEGMAIAAYAVGAAEGYFYIRAEYPLAVQRIRDALRECQDRGYLGDDIPGTGRKLHLRIIEGAGAFVCGEETALLASIEGKRGSPRLRPPFPADRGLWGEPTLVNNVETWTTVPWIMRNGSDAFSALGTETSKGTKVFALAGKIYRGGLIEVPMGVTIRRIVQEIGGGIKDGRRFKAVLVGGPSGGCVPASLADTPVDFEALSDVGAIMGSGGLVVLDESDCMVDIARYFLSFTQDQSCGKCTYCRVGTRRMLDILNRICEGRGGDGDLETLEELAHAVRSGSLCGLGRTAPNPVLSTLRYFRDEYQAHLEGRCPSGKCKALITYRVTDDCIGCTLCAQHCPTDAIEFAPYQKHRIDPDRCTRCDTCRARCPENAIMVN